jgi:hypothetical protein
LKTVGSRDGLANALNVPLAVLEDYMAGNEPVPNHVFMAALDIVAHRIAPHQQAEKKLKGLRLRHRS